jgi:thioredoxin 1
MFVPSDLKRVALGLAGLSSSSATDPKGKVTTVATASNVIHLTTAGFDRVKAQDRPVIIDFWAPWCGPCLRQGPILEQVSSQIGERAIVAKVNVDGEPGLAAPFGVQAIPTLLIMKGGKVVQRFTGLQDAPTLLQALKAAGA